MLDQKKTRAIKHWLELTAPETWNLVAGTQHDLPFNNGAFGESFAGMACMFLNSKANGLAVLDTEWQPLAHESSISIDWSLPLNSKGQFLLFNRVLGDFQKDSALVESAVKKKYRKKEDELLRLRNMFALWGQLRDHVASACGENQLTEKEKKLVSTDFLDEDLDELLTRRPKNFCVSMLASERATAQAKLQQQEEEACMEVESQRVQVRQAKWQFFVKALAQDHLALKQVEAAPQKLAMLQHKKDVAWRQEQSEIGQKAVTSYMNRFLRVLKVDNGEVIKPHVMEYLSYMVRGSNKHFQFMLLYFVNPLYLKEIQPSSPCGWCRTQ